jgi:sigma-E factor negative regulatory protein RseA
MSTNRMSREQISALADNELCDRRVDMALAALRQPEEQAAWDIYHQIGDVLRSDDMAISLRPDFAARIAARLDAEPAIVAPAFPKPPAAPHETGVNKKINTNNRFKRFAMSGAFAAAAASVALVTGPQLMVAMKGDSAQDNAQVMVASTNRPVSHASIISTSAAPQAAVVSPAPPNEAKVLRDPHVDEYLRAHQRFSPSVYSSAQFARSATLARDSEK